MSVRKSYFKAKKIALDNHAERCYCYGWDDALREAADLLNQLKQPHLAILVQGIGQAQVDEETGKTINQDEI